MSRKRPRFLFVFLDGVGVGATPPQVEAELRHNPLVNPATLPFLNRLLGPTAWVRSPVSDANSIIRAVVSGAGESSGCLYRTIDATLGIPGLPQSATGQTSLYTGQNAAVFRGRHQSAFAGGSLRKLIEPYGMFRQVLALGGSATHANCYLPGYFEAIAQRRRRYAVGSLLTLTAGLPFRTLEDYQQENAIYWDITGEIVQRLHGIPAITPKQAGQRLAKLAGQYNLTLFESFLPDFTGHAQDYNQAQRALQRIDQFLESVIAALPSDVTLIVSSDHGNVEDLSTKRHTLNPVPLLVWGSEAFCFEAVTDLTGITPTMLKRLR